MNLLMLYFIGWFATAAFLTVILRKARPGRGVSDVAMECGGVSLFWPVVWLLVVITLFRAGLAQLDKEIKGDTDAL